jgi:hypothetical protein
VNNFFGTVNFVIKQPKEIKDKDNTFFAKLTTKTIMPSKSED